MSVPAVKPVSAPVTIPSHCFLLSDERTSAALNCSFMAGDLRCRMTEAGPSRSHEKAQDKNSASARPSSKPRPARPNLETRPRSPTGGHRDPSWRKLHRFHQFHLPLPLRFRAAFQPTEGAPLPRIWWDWPGSWTNSITISGRFRSAWAGNDHHRIQGHRQNRDAQCCGIDHTTASPCGDAVGRTTPGFLAKAGDDMLRLLDELGDGSPARKTTASSAAG